VVWWVLLQPLGLMGQLVVIGVTTLLGTWLIGRVRERYGVGDPGAIVIDEFAGQWIVLLALPLEPLSVLLGFGLFRLFDIWKPWPVGWLERSVGGGFGVMIDDLAAGILGLGVLQFTLWGLHSF
jgi:phosphatidylglycerophosphatase A